MRNLIYISNNKKFIRDESVNKKVLYYRLLKNLYVLIKLYTFIYIRQYFIS